MNISPLAALASADGTVLRQNSHFIKKTQPDTHRDPSHSFQLVSRCNFSLSVTDGGCERSNPPL